MNTTSVETLRQSAIQFGADDVYDFARSHQNLALGEVFRMLLPSAKQPLRLPSYMDFQFCFFSDANGKNELPLAVQDCLRRRIRQQFPAGWGKRKKIRQRRLGLLATWELPHFLHKDFSAMGTSVIDELNSIELPIDWLPEFDNDPVLSHLISKHWPS